MHPLLSPFLQAVIEKPLYISTQVLDEANTNLFYLSLTEFDIKHMSISDLQEWIKAVVNAKSEQVQVRSTSSHLMCFYCWYDAMAGHLRFSLVSAAHCNALPFSCPLVFTDLQAVLHEVLYPDDRKYIEKIWVDDKGNRHPNYFLEIWATTIP